MKKILSTLVVAILGGIIALGAYSLFDNKEIASERLNLQNSDLPVHYTSLEASENPVIGPDFKAAAERSIHGVVHIITEFTQKSSVYDNFFDIYDFFGMRPRYHKYPIVASGSGVIISDDGYIVTNNHVVQQADKITVTLNDKRTYDAKVIGTDPSTDLALLKINDTGLPYIVYGNSDDVNIGEWVLAVGNPFNLTSTVTAGIVSAKARDINILGNNSSYSAIESFIQTDAAVNKGNSGGALVNTRGELVGINAAIASNTGAYTGYSFAIPVNLVRKVVEDLKRYGEVQRALMGVSIRDLDSKLAEEAGIDNIKGVYIAGVIEEGAADIAGIQPGDVVLNIDNTDVNSPSELLEVLGKKRPGDKVAVGVNRKGKEKSFRVTLKNEQGTTGIVKKKEDVQQAILGAEFKQPDKNLLSKLGIRNGIEVKKTGKGKLASAGVKEGFIITHIDRTAISSVSDLEKVIESKSGGILIEGIYPSGVRAYYGLGL